MTPSGTELNRRRQPFQSLRLNTISIQLNKSALGSDGIRLTQQRSLQQVRVSLSLIFLIHGLIIATRTSRIPVSWIGAGGHNSGQGCRIGFRLLLQSFRPCQTVQS
jgi:hypothetical protein